MARAFEFSEDTKRNAFFRQWNLCAHCGKSLINVYDHAHHVWPNQSGNRSDPEHSWISSLDNCVMLCDSCHGRVHENGNFRTGAVASPDNFPYSHGRQTSLHKTWLIRMKHSFWSI